MNSFSRSLLHKSAIAALAAGPIVGSASGAPVALQDVPLYLLSRADPNVLINMSVETPMGGAAYTDHVGVPAGCAGRTDVSGPQPRRALLPDYRVPRLLQPQKVLRVWSTQFNPTGTAAGMPNHTCSGEWSGNFLNWMSMTAIDMFIMDDDGRQPHRRHHWRSAETVVRRARKTDNDSWFPIKYVNASTQCRTEHRDAVRRCHAVLLQHDFRLQCRHHLRRSAQRQRRPVFKGCVHDGRAGLFVYACRHR